MNIPPNQKDPAVSQPGHSTITAPPIVWTAMECAFDQALARPLVDDPPRRKWSLKSVLSKTKVPPPEAFELSYRAPTVEIEFLALGSPDEELFLERHGELQEIQRNMVQIHEIQTEMASLVESQDETIEEFERRTMEVLDQSSGGLSELMRLKTRMTGTTSPGWLLCSALLLMVVGMHWMMTNLDASGPPQQP